ncbi:hypothetical protein R6Q59_015431 [Mikania micrantha]
MVIFNKSHHFFSLFSKQKKPPPDSRPKKVPWPRSPPGLQPQRQPSPPRSLPSPVDLDTAATQAMKRIPLIKFPQRHLKPSGSANQPQATQAKPAASDAPSAFFSRSAPSETTLGGKASLQPKRTPMTQEEIDAILLGGCL